MVKIGTTEEFKVVFVDKEMAKSINHKLKGKFEGKASENLVVNDSLAYVGIDEPSDEKLGYRELGFNTAKFVKKLGVAAVELDLTLIKEDDLPNFFLGLYLALCVKKTYKSEEPKEEGKQDIFINYKLLPDAELADYMEEGRILAENVMAARNFVNAPSNLLYPEEFARQIKSFVSGAGLGIEYKVLHQKEIVDKGMGLLNIVGDSSKNKPCLVVLSYNGAAGSDKVLALVGKGVCMDTGGYCLKPGSSIYDMKGDMAGAAAVVSAIKAIASRRLRLNVKAVIPIVENRISDASFVPSDVITSYSGKTVEILNTDAEGRLILADAISYAIKDEKATHIVDIATLTGAVVSMLGQTVTGILSNDKNGFYKTFNEASTRYGERHLLLPYYKEHEKMIDSERADIKNLGDKFCGTITAGLFIKAFTEDKPWIHMDIAGTSKMDSPVFSYEEKGPTGTGVVQLYSLAKLLIPFHF